MLDVEGLTKSYGERAAVQALSLVARPGEVLGLLGPNGAGKSTTVAMLSALVRPDQGRIRWQPAGGGPAVDAQGDPDAYKTHIGLVPQDIALHEQLPALTNVRLFGALYGMPPALLKQRSLEVLERVGLADRARDLPATFSGGMKRRLNIACALVHDPDVLLLDEPTAGVDPQSRNAIFDHLEDLKRQGKALVYTTHYMEEVERLADQIVIIDHGRVVANGTLDDLLRRIESASTLELRCEGPVDTQALAALPGVRQIRQQGEQLVLALDELGVDAARVLAHLSDQGVRLRQFGSGRVSLEDVFLALTGRQLRD